MNQNYKDAVEKSVDEITGSKIHSEKIIKFTGIFIEEKP